MKALRTCLVALLVVLAGCSGILGGGGGGGGTTAAPTGSPASGPVDGGSGPTATPASGTRTAGGDGTSGTQTAGGDGTSGTTTGPTGTASPTATPTATPTPTPLPPGVETGTLVNESLGISLTLTGNATVVSNAGVADVTGARVTRGAVLNCARASPFVGASTNGTVSDATVGMSYDPSMLPPNASESNLAVFAYNDTVQFYLEMNGTVDTANDTVVGREVNTTRNTFTRETSGGTQSIEAVVDGTRINYVFVVMHKPTYWEGALNQAVPDRCKSGS